MGPYSSAVIILVAFACNSICAPVSSAGDAGAADAESISTSTTTATEVALRGLANAVTLTGIETNQAAYIILNFLAANGYYNTRNFVLREPCFIKERSGDESDGLLNPKTNFLARLVEDYHSARGYVNYLQRVGEFFNTSNPTHYYSIYLADVISRTSTMKDALANLILHVNGSISLNRTTPPPPAPPTTTQTSADQSAEEGTSAPTSSSSLPSYCSDVCFDQQARIFIRLQKLAYSYIANDVSGLLQQKPAI